MQIEVRNKSWSRASCISEALGEILTPPVKLAFVGSGGKTTSIMCLAEEQRALNRRVLVLTTTHMFIPPKYGVLSGLKSDVNNALQKDRIAVTGSPTGNGKIAWQGEALYREFSAMADVVLIEADGSKQLPLKFPNSNEPVIPSDADAILVLCGLSSIGRPGREVCHRWSLAKDALGIDSDEILIEKEHLCILLEKGYLIPFREKFPGKPIITVFNQADDKKLLNIGKELTELFNPDIGIVSSHIAKNTDWGLRL